MSASAGTVPADVAGVLRPRGRDAATAATEPGPGAKLAVELAVFAALGACGLALWSRLAVGTPFGRLLAALAVALIGGLALAVLGRVADRRLVPVKLLAAAIAVVTIAASLVAVGLPVRLLAPAHWGELSDQLHSGIAGIEHTDLPYRGEDVWIGLTTMLGGGALVGLAAVVTFWPARRPRLARFAGLAVLVYLFGCAATVYPPSAELVWGAALLILIAAWIWLPGLSLHRAPLALAAAGVAATVAIPVSARLSDAGWWDWRHWNLFAPELSVKFQWDHTYGPLSWPQRGTTLMTVHSSQPHYWKVSVLDRFDGYTWQRAAINDPLAVSEVAARRAPIGAALPDRNPQWIAQPDFALEALSSDLVVGAGETQAVKELDGVVISSDGTMSVDTPLDRGDRYSTIVYDPHPTPALLQHVPQRYGPRALGSTLVGLPKLPPEGSTPGGHIDPLVYQAPPTASIAPTEAISVPTWGRPTGAVRGEILDSAYADVYRLARRWSAGSATAYDAVAAIERHLRQGPFRYSADVHNYIYPLPAFLFFDRTGYCQQYSGAMALMLRLLGIPSRVVSGFAPGHYDATTGDYEIRDLDAHSWVEVYFPHVGWVTFDPTPAASPAFRQASDALGHPVVRADAADGGAAAEDLRRQQSEAAAGSATGGSEVGGGGPWAAIGLAILGIGGVAGVGVGAMAARRRAALRRGELADAQLTEFVSALRTLGWELPRRLTLRQLERRFEVGRRPPISRYAAALGRHRYAGAGEPAPGPTARRALRRDLAEGGGLGRRLRALLAIPPGGPSGRRTPRV
jgi:transglutaminase-like putative cysteine protease